jgi:plastocyanin
MMKHALVVLSSIILLCAAPGCDRRDSAQSAAPAGPVRTGTGIIQGVVILAGKPPVMDAIPNRPCHGGAPPLKDESVVCDAAGHLQNVIVYIEDAPSAGPAKDLQPVTIDQVDCHYVPHVVALRTGQTLHVTSSDPVFHNIHGTCNENDPFNFALINAGQSKDMQFAKPELFPVRCDVHPWMKAWIDVFPHPWFAVTGPDGSFVIHNVPSGKYTLVAWQEKYGKVRTPIVVSDGKASSASFTVQSGL